MPSFMVIGLQIEEQQCAPPKDIFYQNSPASIRLDIRRPIRHLLAHFFAWSNAEGDIFLASSKYDVITTLTSMISNYDLTEKCELLNSMWTALVQLSCPLRLWCSGFCLVGILHLSQN